MSSSKHSKVPNNLDEEAVRVLVNIITNSINKIEKTLDSALYDYTENDILHLKKLIQDEENEIKNLKETYPEYFL